MCMHKNLYIKSRKRVFYYDIHQRVVPCSVLLCCAVLCCVVGMRKRNIWMMDFQKWNSTIACCTYTGVRFTNKQAFVFLEALIFCLQTYIINRVLNVCWNDLPIHSHSHSHINSNVIHKCVETRFWTVSIFESPVIYMKVYWFEFSPCENEAKLFKSTLTHACTTKASIVECSV